MFKTRTTVFLAAAILVAGCTQTGNTPAPMTAVPMDPNSVTVFTLALQPGISVSGCILGDASMTRPVTLTVSNDKGRVADGGPESILADSHPARRLRRRRLNKDQRRSQSGPKA